ncbi:hypothetical protein [Lutibacter sp.]
MKYIKYLFIRVLKITTLVGLVFMSTTQIYAQDNTKEDALISLDFTEKNNIKTIKATVTNKIGEPVEELDLYFFVKRTFSLLPIGDVFNTTDENGEVEVEFPKDLPASDTEGNVVILVKILESDLYNDLTVETTKKWGVPISDKEYHQQDERSLWATAANAPMSLIVSISIMILSVWYIIFYILYKLYIISKIKPSKL